MTVVSGDEVLCEVLCILARNAAFVLWAHQCCWVRCHLSLHPCPFLSITPLAAFVFLPNRFAFHVKFRIVLSMYTKTNLAGVWGGIESICIYVSLGTADILAVSSLAIFDRGVSPVYSHHFQQVSSPVCSCQLRSPAHVLLNLHLRISS